MLLKDKRIFITEDDLGNRAIMQFLLERAGAIVAFERWGRDTCERLEAFAPVDLILLDLMFPDNITGYDVFDRIREIPEFATIPIVAVSAADPDTAIPKTKEKGFAGFISKPIDRYEIFIQQLNDILDGHNIWYAG